MTKCILIKTCINAFSISTKTLIKCSNDDPGVTLTYFMRRLHVACTINVAFDAMQKLIII